MKNRIYKIKDGIEETELNKLAELDYVVVPNEKLNLTFVKFVDQPVGGDLYNHLLINYYNNPEWKEKIYKNNKKKIRKKTGIRYDKDGNLIKDEQLEMILVAWRIEMSKDDDYWLGLKSADPFDTNYYYNADLLDKYCSKEIAKLKELELIEEYFVED